MKKINVALVGLGFGGAFVEIYAAHPNVGTVTICDKNQTLAARFSGVNGVRVVASLEDIVSDDSIDAVHLVTPIPCHAEHAAAVLRSGKHCACTVPMATAMNDIDKILNAARDSGKNYMLMETTLYTYQYLYASEMLAAGKFGRVQFLRGSHYQDMTGWPPYWNGFPPMWYGTHAVAPLLGLSGSRIKTVYGFGSGAMDDALVRNYGNPYPFETAIFEFENGLKAEASRSLFETARAYREGFSVYGSDACFEWGYRDEDDPYITTRKSDGRAESELVVDISEMPNFYERLPEPLWRFTVGERYDSAHPIKSLRIGAGGGHHGAHPHLVHAFVDSIVNNVKPRYDERFAANLSAACILAHESAMLGGKPLEVPTF